VIYRAEIAEVTSHLALRVANQFYQRYTTHAKLASTRLLKQSWPSCD